MTKLHTRINRTISPTGGNTKIVFMFSVIVLGVSGPLQVWKGRRVVKLQNYHFWVQYWSKAYSKQELLWFLSQLLTKILNWIGFGLHHDNNSWMFTKTMCEQMHIQFRNGKRDCYLLYQWV